MNDFLEFDQYIRQGEPNQQERAAIWRTAIGLQAVDGLQTSDYLKETALKHIEGEIDIDEARQLIKTYYQSKATRETIDDDQQEADKASANITKILSSVSLDFSANGFIALHRRIFDGVLKHAGEIRHYDITKKEWVLNADTVNYLNWEDLYRALEFDIEQERNFSYKNLSLEQQVVHIAQFVSSLWQIHPFDEGNTRTTAVFTILYLRHIGFGVENDLFAEHSWYFRNALVRANYKNARKGIDYSPIYLERFFRNLLLGENHPLQNRELHLDWQPVKEQEQVQSATQSAKTEDLSLSKCKNCTLDELAVLRIVQNNPSATQKQIAVAIGKSERTVKTLTVSLTTKGIISRRNGKRNGYWEITNN